MSGRVFYLSLQACLNALAIGVVAKGLVLLISLFTNLAFYGRFSFAENGPAGNQLGLFVIAVPVLGSLIVGVMARFGSKAIRGHGIPEAMENIILHQSRIPPIITLLKPLSAAISIGTGGPFGAEGPIIATGGAIGSFTGQVIHISAAERKVLLAAGACAGMSAIFGSPLAAILLAIELLLFEFSPRAVIPVAIACITGGGMHLLLFDNQPVFAMPDIPAVSDKALLTYVLMGAVIGVVAAGVSRSVYWVEDLFEKLPIHWMWWPAIGGLAVGGIGYFAPHTMGVGYDNIKSLLTGQVPLLLILSLCILKYLSWVISLGSGTSGGTLAPLFTIGGALGALLGAGVLHLLPGSDINIATAALIGMAAMFAGSSRALLTAIVFALETTGQTHGLLPLIGACTTAYFVSFFLMKGSIMTEKIRRRGVATPEEYTPDLLQQLSATAAMQPSLVSIQEQMTSATVSRLLEQQPCYQAYLPVTDAGGRFKGYLHRAGLAADNAPAALPLIPEKNLPYVLATDNMQTVTTILGSYPIDVLAVLDNSDHKQLLGVITAADVLAAYTRHRIKDAKYHSAFYGNIRLLRVMARGKTILARS
ncbi:chloride channel protein [Chitinophaga nivalis]|uniref:Chloride channel protein n=1 Tax=Chitinophaga nivalis TaxID=2991709 RepID=A0ABT3IGZ0_9BACT|nr:chloride channel protein [Chitinophaga nivalis]MCW3467238.1 chloride channel protein [Chitinophaga nivalis]MCW3483070.1 chloride channel protein [Chitinophaga nivalis]